MIFNETREEESGIIRSNEEEEGIYHQTHFGIWIEWIDRLESCEFKAESVLGFEAAAMMLKSEMQTCKRDGFV